MKNKIMALLVLVIFVISLVPMAIAEEQSNAESDSTLEAQPGDNGDARLGLGQRLKVKQKVLERRADKLEKKFDVLDRRADKIGAKVDFLARHKEQINGLIKKCEEKGRSNEECKNVFEKRLRNLDSLPENFKQRLAQFEERKEQKEQELEDIENDGNFNGHKKELKFKARVVQKQRLEMARKNVIKSKIEFKEAKAKLETARLRLESAKKLDLACKNPDSEECKNARAELLAAAKEHFSAQADHIVKALENIKSRLVGNEDLSDELEAKLVAEIDAEIAKINNIKAKINAAQNKEELLKAARELRAEWQKMKHKAKRFAAIVVSSKMAGIIVTSKHLEVKLERVLARMAENGQDVSEVQSLVDEFHTHLDLARTAFKASQDLWLKAKLDAAENTTVQEAQEKLKEARGHLKEAREVLWKIIQKVDKKVLKDIEAEDELEAPVEAEASASEDASAEVTEADATATPEAAETETTSAEASANASETSGANASAEATA